MAWITAAVALAQMIGGMASNSKKQAEERMKASGVGTPSKGISEMVNRTRIQANTTQAPGASVDQEFARQGAADAVGVAKDSFTDASKVSNAVTKAHIMKGRADQQIIKRGEEFKERAEGRHMAALGAQAGEEQRNKELKDNVYMEAETAKANLMGAGLNNLTTTVRDKNMMDFYSKLYGVGGGKGGGFLNFFKNLGGRGSGGGTGTGWNFDPNNVTIPSGPTQ